MTDYPMPCGCVASALETVRVERPGLWARIRWKREPTVRIDVKLAGWSSTCPLHSGACAMRNALRWLKANPGADPVEVAERVDYALTEAGDPV